MNTTGWGYSRGDSSGWELTTDRRRTEQRTDENARYYEVLRIQSRYDVLSLRSTWETTSHSSSIQVSVQKRP